MKKEGNQINAYNVEKRNKSRSLISDNNSIVHDQAFVMKQLKTIL